MRLTESHLRKIIREELDKLSSSSMNESVFISDNVKQFTKGRPAAARLVRKVAGWADKVGKKIINGTTMGYANNTLLLDMTRNGGEITISLEDGTIKLYSVIVNSPQEFEKVFNEKFGSFN